MNNTNKLVISLSMLLLLFVLTQIYHFFFTIKEGIVFRKRYLLKKYKKDNIIVDKNNYTLEKDGKKIYYRNQLNTQDGHDACIDKSITSSILKKNNIPVSKFYVWNRNITTRQNLDALNGFKPPFVVKPTIGTQGYSVKTDITNQTELLEHVNKLLDTEDVMVEEQAKGNEYRIMVLNNNIVSITKRGSPFIIGTGNKTIRELIDIYNDNVKFKVHTIDKQYIKQQGYNETDIVPNGVKVKLTNVANYSNGGGIEYVDIAQVHPENINLFKKINNVLSLNLSGIDYITDSLAVPYNNTSSVIEVNSAPGFDVHYDSEPEATKESLIDRFVNYIFI